MPNPFTGPVVQQLFQRGGAFMPGIVAGTLVLVLAMWAGAPGAKAMDTALEKLIQEAEKGAQRSPQ